MSFLGDKNRSNISEKSVESHFENGKHSEDSTKNTTGTSDKIKRHPDFERILNPFGLEFHVASAILMIHSHIIGAYAFYLTFTGKVPLSTFVFDVLVFSFSGLGVTIGCHRYWSHRTFKATKPLQILLMIMQTSSLQLSIYKWSLDHRLHHKFADTDKDPYNSKRGFFFSHMGWLFMKKHPEFQKALDTFEVPDLENDPIVRFQSRWYWTLAAIFFMAIPVSLLYIFWDLPLLYCIAINYRRFIFSTHVTSSINSVAHMFGDRPYDKNITAVENRVMAFFAGGEGWHNYHHTFPWDYKASEFGWKLNPSAMVIDFFAWLGWAYDLKTVSPTMLEQRIRRTGDGSRETELKEKAVDNESDITSHSDATKILNDMDHVWGWGDETLAEYLGNSTVMNSENKLPSL